MVQSDTQHELGKFLKGLQFKDMVFFVLQGAVISGGFVNTEDVSKVIELLGSKTSTGGSQVETDNVYIPREKIIAWGYLGDEE